MSEFWLNYQEKRFRKKVKKIEKKLGKYRPDLLKAWYEDLENKLNQEYQDEFEQLQADCMAYRNEIASLRSQLTKATTRNEVMSEQKDELLDRLEKSNENAGKLKTTVKNLNIENKELTEQVSQISEEKPSEDEVKDEPEISDQEDEKNEESSKSE